MPRDVCHVGIETDAVVEGFFVVDVCVDVGVEVARYMFGVAERMMPPVL